MTVLGKNHTKRAHERAQRAPRPTSLHEAPFYQRVLFKCVRERTRACAHACVNANAPAVSVLFGPRVEPRMPLRCHKPRRTFLSPPAPPISNVGGLTHPPPQVDGVQLWIRGGSGGGEQKLRPYRNPWLSSSRSVVAGAAARHGSCSMRRLVTHMLRYATMDLCGDIFFPTLGSIILSTVAMGRVKGSKVNCNANSGGSRHR